jgi:hypothetical protein
MGGTPEEKTRSQEQNMANNDVDKPYKVPSPSFAAPPLAPLEYLQNQRKGAITDPSLHAAGYNGDQNIKKSYAMGDAHNKQQTMGQGRGSAWRRDGKRSETGSFMKVIMK